MNLPNKLTVLRIILIPIFIAVYFLTVIPYNYVISAGVFLIASLTDFLDGHIARKYNLVTDLGKFLDPIADKILVSTALIIMLVAPVGGVMILPWYYAIAVAIILARELLVSGFRMLAASKGKVLAADWSGKIKTTVQDASIVILLVSANFVSCAWINVIGLIALFLATLLTIYSGAECLIKNRAIIVTK